MKKLNFTFFVWSLCVPAFLQVQAKSTKYGLTTGSVAPNIVLEDITGKKFSLNDTVKQGPVVLVFYRGGWCPYCNTQLRSINKNIGPLAKKNSAKIVAISVDLLKEGISTSKTNKLDMTILSDTRAEVLHTYNLAYKVPAELVRKYKNEYGIDLEKAPGQKHHVIAVPAVFVVSKKGHITYSYVNEDYKVRAPEAEIKSAIVKASGVSH